jgi:hypothetical protein
MNAPAKKLRAVPAPGIDPVLDAQVAVTKAAEATALARTAVTVARLAEQGARNRFDAEDASVTVVDLAQLRERKESEERKCKVREDAEQQARTVLAQLQDERTRAEYDARIAHAQAWRSRMGSALVRFAALDGELARAVEEVVDLIADATVAHQEAEALELSVRPIISMAAKNITAPTVNDARHMVQIHVARERAKAGRDGLADGFLSGQDRPAWNDPNRTAFNAAVAALDALEKTT